MNKRSVGWLALGALSGACVQYNTHQNTASVSVAATVTNVSVTDTPQGGAVLTSVPDIPSVAGARVDVQTIRNALDPYGNWVDDGTFGVVWIPSEAAVGSQFVPYGSNGQWVPTDQGWYWESHYQWGWLPFHYGRWVLIRETWAWVPGSRFAPAWVDWRESSEYVGWAPLPPQGAEFMAPYAFVRYTEIIEYNVWSYAVYGSAGAMLYSESTSMRAAYGVGGAYYAWGPTLAQTGCSPSAVVPIAQAWGTETSAARGGSSGGVVVTPTSPSTPSTPSGSPGPMARTTPPVSQPAPGTGPGSPGSPSSVARQPPQIATNSTPPVIHPPGGPNAIAAPRVDMHPAEVAFNPAAYRPRDTVVIRDSVAYAPRNTVSLGTTQNYVAPTSNGYGSTGYTPPVAATYTPPAVVNSGYTPPVPTYSPPPTTYSPPPVVAASPSYSTPTYTPPAGYTPTRSTYVAPSAPSYSPPPTYAAPHVTYSPPSVVNSAPPSAPAAAYHPGFVRTR